MLLIFYYTSFFCCSAVMKLFLPLKPVDPPLIMEWILILLPCTSQIFLILLEWIVFQKILFLLTLFMISLNSLIPGQDCEILAVASDGDCFPHCVSLHFNLIQNNNEHNIRYDLANKIATHMDEVVSLARDNAKVSFNLMNWFLSLRERDNRIGTGSQPILQSSILQESGQHIDVDIFFTQYKLTLNEALRLLHDFTKLSAAHAKHDSTIYFD